MSQTSIYNIWSDGSYRPNKDHAIGAGWIIKHNDVTTEYQAVAMGLEKEARFHGSFVAEIYAVSCALSSIPANSRILLRLDAQNVIDVLNKGVLSKSLQQIIPLAVIFQKVMQTKNSMSRFDIVKASDNNNPNMKRVNDMARMAAGRELMSSVDTSLFALTGW